MRAYILRRLLQSMLVVFVVTTIMFFMFRVMPADPTTMFLEGGMTEEARQVLLEEWGLNGTLWEQYVRYMGNLLTGDFGNSFFYRKPAWDVLWPFIINTLWIAVPGLLLGAVIGSGLGMIVGWAPRGGKVERSGILLATIIRGAPSFVVGIMLLAIFSSWLNWVPGYGMGDPQGATGLMRYLNWDFAHHLILPLCAVIIFFIPENLLLMRSGVVEARTEDYIELVRAKGVSEGRVAWHAGRNSMLPLITWLFPALAETIAGIVVVEIVFSWPGVGRELVLAVVRQDYPVAQAAFFLMSIMIVLANLAADLTYSKLDPRVVYK
ncbi:ABC transporter permease [Oceaniovalibus sp. ACAM 378]|jgi:peptide/nickel transport system permease protein|uniref:ABC transporter permease n=1 Tax=Oceaniovalibus sp. ACAM 378 TaxID=2599923 RepID=UPI0011DAD2EA|nr:ABC transporter permease [Oceaniovalibus sp. ACAM 378]TYB89080.1 ABC transporter permease [Oceaniovalibus sp. ACAM 378]